VFDWTKRCRLLPRAFMSASALGAILAMSTIDHAFAQDSWTTKTSDPNPTSSVASVEVNGLIYVYGSAGTLSIYNPATDVWMAGAAPTLSRAYVSAAVINGKVYVVGGCTNNSDCRIGTTNALEIYDPVANSWSNGSPMATARFGAAAGAIAGKLYVTGGSQACPPCVDANTTEIYDPTLNSWTPGASIPNSREQPMSAVVNGLLYAIGGYERDISAPVGIVSVYDPTMNSWSTGSPMPTARTAGASGVINGDIYVVGGTNASNVDLATNESYDPSSDIWTERAPMPTARHYTTGSVVSSNLFVIDGTENGTPLGTNEEYTAISPSPTTTPTATSTGLTPTSTPTAAQTPLRTPTFTATATISQTPTSTGTRTATATITGTPSPTITPTVTATVTMTATVTAIPTVTITPTPVPAELTIVPKVISFGAVFVGQVSKSHNVLLRNLKNKKQNAPITINSILPSTGEFVASQNCIGQLAPGAKCAVAIILSPAAGGPRGAQLAIASNARGTAASVTLQGTGKIRKTSTSTPSGIKTPTRTATPKASPTPVLKFTAPTKLVDAIAGTNYPYDFCQPPPGSGQLCGSPFSPSTNPSGGNPPYTFSTKGFPPPGVTLDFQTGHLSGAPDSTDAGHDYKFTVCATDLSANEVCNDTMLNVNAVATPTASSTPKPGGTPIGVNGCKVGYEGGNATCTSSGGFGFDNCSGSITLDIQCAITSGEIGVTIGNNDDFTTCGASVSPGSVPGTIMIPCDGGIAEGDCPPGNQVIVGDDNTRTIAEATVQTFGWSCGPGA